MKSKFVFGFLFGILLLWVACGDKETPEELMKQGEAFEQEEKFDEALHAYEKLSKRFPESELADDALQKAALLNYNNLNDFQKAIELESRLIKDFPQSQFVPQARFLIGFIYANNLQDYDKAREAYEAFLANHADHELAESVKWELEHLGQDINEQTFELFGKEDAGGDTKVN